MHKRSRILLSLLPALVTAAVFVLTKHGSNDFYDAYLVSARKLVRTINYPFVLTFVPVLHGLDWVSGFFPFVHTPGLTATIVRVAVVLALIILLSGFWYFVLLEFEKRRDGKSMLRFPGLFAEVLMIASLFFSGFGAFVWMYFQTIRELGAHHGWAHLSLSWPFLLGWGVVLIGMSVFDLRFLLRKRAGDGTGGATFHFDH